MSIRIRTVDGVRVALCAVETDELPGDVYLDDADHYALAAKFAQDWSGQMVDWTYPDEWAGMETQKLRDAATEDARWQAEERFRALMANPYRTDLGNAYSVEFLMSMRQAQTPSPPSPPQTPPSPSPHDTKPI